MRHLDIYFWIIVGIGTVFITIRDLLRDIIIEAQIRMGVLPKEARKNFSLKKLVSGEYKKYFNTAKGNYVANNEEKEEMK